MKQLLTICLLVATAFLTQAQESLEIKTYEENGKNGLADNSGKRISAPLYDIISAEFYEGLCTVELNDKHGFINKKGIEVIPLIYDMVFDFNSGKALVFKDSLFYFINPKAEVVSPGYKLLKDQYFKKNAFILLIKDVNGREGFVDLWEKKILTNFYDIIYKSENGIHAVKIDDKYGFVDSSGEEIIPVIYDQVFNFNGELAIVRIDSKWGIINKLGKSIVPHKYYSIDDFSEGLAVVNKGGYFRGKHGYIDEKGNEIIPIIYDVAEAFKNGTAKVRIADDVYFINKKGERIK